MQFLHVCCQAYPDRRTPLFLQLVAILEKQTTLKLALLSARPNNFEKALASQETLAELSCCEAACSFNQEAINKLEIDESIKTAVKQWCKEREQQAVCSLLGREMKSLRDAVTAQVTERLQRSTLACEQWQGGKKQGSWHDDVKGVQWHSILQAAKQTVMKVDVATQLKAVTTELTKDL